MKLTTRDKDQQNALVHAFHDRERFTLTGAGLQAEFVGEVLNRVPCVFNSGLYDTNLELVQVTEAITHAAWTGEGLPPAGTVCEHRRVHEWQQVEVFAVKPNYNGSNTALFTYGNGCWAGCAEPSFFRPIRTPEQIAAEEREKAIDQMLEDAQRPGNHMMSRFHAEDLYDAGYRKQ